MKRSWTLGIEPEKAEEVVSDFKQSVGMRERLTTLIEKKIKTNYEGSISKEQYNISNWAYLQADACGYERALNEVISLISNDSVEKD